MLVLAAVMLPLLSSQAEAKQLPMASPRDVALAVSGCMTMKFSHYLTGPAWFEELDIGYRVVLPLRGDPASHANSQFPPPAEDTVATIDLYRYDDPNNAPRGIEKWDRNVKFYAREFLVELSPGDPVYFVRLGGYDWYTIGWRTVGCLDEIRRLIM